MVFSMLDDFLWAATALMGVVIAGVCPLQFFRLDVPGAIFSGESLFLGCEFDQESDNLYSVKWYKNNEEFYRYLPRDQPPGQKYDLLGVYVDLSLSNLTHVYLTTTDLNTEGTYACEVSADAPSFRTFKSEKDLRVYVIPPEDPQIHGISRQYEIGDELNLTCTSGPAKPAPSLRWYINDEKQTAHHRDGGGVALLGLFPWRQEAWLAGGSATRLATIACNGARDITQEGDHPLMGWFSLQGIYGMAPKNYQNQHQPIRHSNGLLTSKIGLQLLVEPSYLWAGTLKVQCLAAISQVYSKTSDELVIGGTAPSGVNSDEEGPIITGGSMWYNIGDIVDVNCTSPKSLNAAELKWFINDQEIKRESIVLYPVTKDEEGLEYSVLGLKFQVKKTHLKNAEMRLKCTAALSKVIRMSSEETVLGASRQSSGLRVLDNNSASSLSGGPDICWRTLCKSPNVLTVVFALWFTYIYSSTTTTSLMNGNS